MTIALPTQVSDVSSDEHSAFNFTPSSDRSSNDSYSNMIEHSPRSLLGQGSSSVGCANLACKFPILAVDDTADTTSRTTRLTISSNELEIPSNWSDLKYRTAVIQAIWSLVLRAYTGNDKICFGYSSAIDAPQIISCSISQSQKPAQLTDYLTNYQQHEDIWSYFEDDLLDIFNTAISVHFEGDPGISRGPEEAFKQCAMLATVNICDTEIVLDLFHSPEYIPIEVAEHVSFTFNTILGSFLENFNESMSCITTLSDQSKSQILQSNESVPPVLNQNLCKAFAETALDNPDCLAISSLEREWTYAELDLSSTQLSEHLISLHDGRASNTPVALLLYPPSCIGVITLLAILKAGLTCIPVESESLLIQAVQDVGPRLICVAPLYADKTFEFEGTVLIVDENLLGSLQTVEPLLQSLDDYKNDVAFVQYTRGTVGPPRGVKQGHAGLYTGLIAHGQVLGLETDSRVLHSNSYTTLSGISEVFGAFIYGCCLVILPTEKDLDLTTESINIQEVTHASFNPTRSAGLDPMALWHLSSVTLAGEGFTREELDTWGLETELTTTYGAIETGVYVSACRAPSRHTLENIGSPFVASFWVVNKDNIQELAPIGAVGNLVIGGPTLALGYLKDVASSSSDFLINPKWAPVYRGQDQRFFITGDLVRQLGNGEYSFCGRNEEENNQAMNSRPEEPGANLLSSVQPFALLGPETTADEAKQAAVTACGIRSDMITDIYPVTPMQEGLFALSNKEPGAFIKQDVFQIPPNLDIERFRDAWAATIDQSAILRTRFIMTDSLRLLQVVTSDSPPCQIISDLESYLAHDLANPMLLGRPLFRYAIMKNADEKSFLVMTMHHSIFDGWTLGLIFDRVKHNYEMRHVASESPFSSFISHLQSLDRERTEDFWKFRLENSQSTDFPTLPSVSYHPVPNDTIERFLDFRKTPSSTATASTLVHAAWALTVALYAGSEDVVFGSTVFGRAASVPGIVDMMGPTVTTIPFRTKVCRNTNMECFLRQVQDESAMAIPYEQAGIHRIQKLTEATRIACSFQTSLIVQAMERLNGLEDLGCHRMNEMRDSYQPYAFNVEICLRQDGAEVSVLFDNQVIETHQVERVVNTFNEILQKLNTAEPEASLGSVMSISTSDMEELNDWNEIVPEPLYKCVHDAFSEQAQLSPNAPAIAAWDGDLTYSELDSLSDTLAAHISSYDVQAETVIPMHFEKSKWSIVSILAVLKAGATCLSFDVSNPPDRLSEMVKAVNAKMMLIGKAPSETVTEHVNRTITIDAEFFETIEKKKHRKVQQLSPRNRAFIVFTSGSTGNPKGIELEHQAVSFSSYAYAAAVKIGPSSRCLQYSSFAFDVYITDIFAALVSGACCCIPSEEDRMNNVSHGMNKLSVTHADITPTVADLLRHEDVPGLQSLVVGGEPLKPETARCWANQVNLVNMYSQSETSNWVTHCVVKDEKLQTSNIGRGDGMSTWIVDQFDESKLAPIGCIGELFVGGPALARGYLNDPIKTSESFIEAPLCILDTKHSNSRLYRTNDLVKYDSDGTLVFVGRKDAQIKLHGQRLELSEIDLKIIEVSHVKACLTVFPKAGLCQGRCVAVISLKDFCGDESEPLRMIEISQLNRVSVADQLAKIRDRLLESLARWMVPTFWVVVGNIPRNVSGKSDRKKAQTFIECLDDNELQFASQLLSENQFQSPHNAMEELLQRIWGSVLGLSLDQISTTASFWRLGGDSVTAMQVVAKCRAEGTKISVHDLLNSKSLVDVADLADSTSNTVSLAEGPEQVSANAAPHSPHGPNMVDTTSVSESLLDTILEQASVKPSNVEMSFQASDYQVSALEQMLLSFRGDLTYHTFDIPKPTSFTRLSLAIVEVVNAHPLMRSVFVAHQREVYQVVLKASFVDLTEERNDTELTTLIESDRKLEFRLGQPMVSFRLMRHGPSHESDSLVIRLPHCIYDAYTLASFVSDLEQAYLTNNALERPVDISPYLNYRKTTRDQALSYWRKYLEGAKTNQIVSKPALPFHHGQQQTLTSSFRMGSLKSYGISSATLFKSAWGLLLTRLFGENDIVFGEIKSGRGLDLPDIDSMNVVCASTVPLRITLDHSWQIIDLLRHVQEQQLATMPFEFVGEASIVQNCTSWSKAARFSSVVNHIPLYAEKEAGMKPFRSTGIHGNLNPSADLNVQCHSLHGTSELEQDFQVRITFDQDFISREFVAKIKQNFCDILDQFTTDVCLSLDKVRADHITGYSLPISLVTANSSTMKNVQSIWDRAIGYSGDIDTPFFAHQGSVVAAAHLVSLYEQRDIFLSMEDVLGAPTIREQVELILKRG